MRTESRAFSKNIFNILLWVASMVFLMIGFASASSDVGLSLVCLAYIVIAAVVALLLSPDLRFMRYNLMKKAKFLTAVCIIFLAWGILAVVFAHTTLASLGFIFIPAYVILAFAVLITPDPGGKTKLEDDERYKKIMAVSMADSWKIMVAMMIVTVMAFYIARINISIPQAMTLLLAVAVFAQMLSYAYYGHTGDAD